MRVNAEGLVPSVTFLGQYLLSLSSYLLCPRQDSNLRSRFRKPSLYPLSYEGLIPTRISLRTFTYESLSVYFNRFRKRQATGGHPSASFLSLGHTQRSL